MNQSTALVVYEPPGFIQDFSMEYLPEDGYVAHRYILVKGWHMFLLKMMYNYRICISKYSSMFIDDAWCYNKAAWALQAFLLWEPEKQEVPQLWIKEVMTGRRREYDCDGNLKREWIQP